MTKWESKGVLHLPLGCVCVSLCECVCVLVRACARVRWTLQCGLPHRMEITKAYFYVEILKS